jgi:hypothetical protein
MSREPENEREYRLIDQLMTAHAVLRDRFCRRARALSVLLLSLALALNAFVFTNEDMLKRVFFGYIAEPKIFIGFISIGLLILSIVGIRVDWEGRSRSHAEALERLGRLKARYREAHASAPNAEIQSELGREYARTMELLPPIPEQLFTRLKAYHQFKRLLSRELDSHPGVPAWILGLRLRWRAIRQINTSQEIT